MIDDHTLEMETFPYLGDSEVMYRARCSCGRYVSDKCANLHAAKRAWLDHARAKTEANAGTATATKGH